ncbi:Cold shock domain-containing protein 4 [Diplonema papillatum]|nr:Cold shock domain-containing protein 4 [Diplonema papillatum]
MFKLTRLVLGTHTGKVVRWLDNKGFGFIQRADNDAEVFVHQTSIRMRGFRSLAEQQDVEFDVETDHMGREKAINVTAPGGEDPKPFARDNY